MNTPEDKIFQTLKDVPCELSNNQVIDMIAKFDDIVLEKSNWWSKITFNSLLIMILATSIIAACIFVFLKNGEETKPIPTLTTFSGFALKNKPQDKAQANEKVEVSKLKGQVNEPVLQNNTQKKQRQHGNHSSDVPTHAAGASASPSASPSSNQPSQIVEEEYDEDFGEENDPVISTENSTQTANSKIKINPVSKALYLKLELSAQLLKDGLITDKNSNYNITYSSNAMAINKQTISNQLLPYYKALFSQYQISPGPNRKIMVTPKKIRIGDEEAHGFEGLEVQTEKMEGALFQGQ